MTPRAWYRTGQLGEIAAAVAVQDERRAEAPADDDPLVFRDVEGRYWWLAPGGDWRRGEGGEWRAATRPDELEGVADWVATVSPPAASPAEDRAPATDVASFLERLAFEASADYRRGAITSDEAEGRLAGAAAVDRDGGAWSVGCRSGRWYRFAEGAWAEMEGPPDSETLVDAGAMPDACPSCGREAGEGRFCAGCGAELAREPTSLDEAAEERLLAFLERDDEGLLPEPVSDPWRPPVAAAAPAPSGADRSCPECHVPVLADARFCPYCGADLVAPAARPTCGSCGAAVEPVDAFCPSCGTRLSEPEAAFRPTHRVPAGGIPAWERPDLTLPATTTLEGGRALRVEERRDAWARVVAEDGFSGWVDARLLEEAPE